MPKEHTSRGKLPSSANTLYKYLPFLRALYKRPRGRPKDPEAERRFIQIAQLWKKGKSWDQIAKELEPEVYLSADACKKIFMRHLPEYLEWWRLRFEPDTPKKEFLARVLLSIRRKAGRPKSGQKSRD